MPNTKSIHYKGVLFISACFLIAGIACSEPDPLQMMQTAKQYLSEQKIREASLELKSALKQKPDLAEARYLLGQINLTYGDFEGAEKEFIKADKAGWKEEEAQVGLANALLHLQKYQSVLEDIDIKPKYSPTAQANLYGIRAYAQANNGLINQAMASIKKGNEIDPNAIELLKAKIDIKLSKDDLDGSRKSLEQALSTHPDHPDLLLLSAIIAIKNNNRPVAMDAYQKIIDQDPPKLFSVNGRKARLGLARHQIFEKQFDAAQSTLELLLKSNGKDPEANFVAGWLAFSQGDYNNAEESLLKVLKLSPTNLQTQYLLGMVKFAQQNFEQATYYIGKYVSAVPEDIEARKLLSRAYIILGQQDEAQATLKADQAEIVIDSELLALAGLSQMQAGNFESGIKNLENAVKMEPGQVSLRRELARAYISSGETDRAIQQLNTLLQEGDEDQQTKSLMVMAHLRAGKFDQAIDTALGMVQTHPQDPAILTLAGNVFIASKDKTEAKKYFNKALSLKPLFAPAIMSLSHLEEKEGHYAEAEKLYKRIIDADKTSIEPLIGLARLAELQGNKKSMFDWLEQARDQAPRNIKPRGMLAEYYLREGQHLKAEQMVQEALQIGTRQPELLILQSRILMAQARYQDALTLLKELITKQPESALTRVLMGESYLNLNDQKAARRQLDIVLKQQPYYLPALLLMARTELKAKHPEKALDYVEQVQKIKPDLPVAFEIAGDAQLSRNEISQAISAYRQAWGHQPSSQLSVKLSEALKQNGEPQAAQETLLSWLKNHPNDVRPLQFLGTSYQDQGLNDKAIQTYKKVLELDEENVVALNNLAWLYSLTNNPKAINLAKRAYQASPDDVGIQDTYGWILVQQGQVKRGRALLEQVMQKLSDIPEVRYHYAVALLKSGETEDALRRLRELLATNKPFEGKNDIQEFLH